ncbi:MAG TPA: nitrilase-related carbon-nitrogen hydrolase, partial [Gaiellaceae bacterium]|nr:nitrilase-related carbon-nitrogen hydrolase [Gaiellaceae bacterium]
METVRIACAQLAPKVGEAEHNRSLAREAVRSAVAAGARLVVLPELCTSGYVFESAEEARSLAQPPDGPALRDWAEEAARGDALVIGGF